MALSGRQNNQKQGGTGAGPAQHNPLSPGRVVTREEPVWLPDGSKRVFREVKTVKRDGSGNYVTHEKNEMTPPLDCSCQPEDKHDVFQCCRCLSAVCGNHSYTCPECGRVYCTGCRENVEVGNEEAMATKQLCPGCAKEVTTPVILLFLEKLFFGEV